MNNRQTVNVIVKNYEPFFVYNSLYIPLLKNSKDFYILFQDLICLIDSNGYHALQKRELSTILGDIIKHMTPDRAYEDFYPQLQSVITKILAHQHDFSLLFSLVSSLKLCCNVKVLLHIVQRWQIYG